MAKTFYNAKEAAQKLGMTETDLKELVRKGTLREFRDAGTVNYKIGEIDALAAKSKSGSSAASASASGEIVLEPVEESTIGLASSGSDIMSLEEVDANDTATGMRVGKKPKEGTAVPSVGVNVFDDEELDEMVDPLAQTAVTDVGGLGIDGVGSGSGILDLTRESDDTSLGAELLEEIYTGEEEGAGAGGVEMGEATRAGLDEAIPATADEAAESFQVAESVAGQPRAVVRQVVEYGPDAVSTGLTALMIVGVIVIWFAGLGAAGLVRGITPALIQSIYQNLAIYAGCAVGVAGIASAATYFYMKRSA